MKNVAIKKWDENGLGDEPNNLAAINSLIGYRSFRYGKHLDLIITDQHSYRSADPFSDPEARQARRRKLHRACSPRTLQQVLDGGRAFNGGNPPAELAFGDARIANPQQARRRRRSSAPSRKPGSRTSCSARPRRGRSGAIRKARPTERADPQNLPAGLTKQAWPAGLPRSAPAIMAAAYTERAEIYDLVRDAKITGFAIVSGDRHSFWAGYATSQLPPGKFEPVGLSFVGGSLSSAGAMEAYEHSLPKDHPLRPLFLADRPGAAKPDWTYNMLLKHGVRSCLEYAKSFDLARARSLVQPGACAAPRVRRSGRAWLCEGSAHRR